MVGGVNQFEELYRDCHEVGGMSRYAYEDDPKRLAFTAARYKHTAKLLEGRGRVLEVGCSDGYFSRIVRQHVEELVAVDVDGIAIEEAKRNASKRWPIVFLEGGMSAAVYYFRDQGLLKCDAVYCLDVLEHIPPGREEFKFLNTMADIARVAVIGTPSLESQVHASRLSREGHVNCKSGPELRSTLEQHWPHVFMFSMHDEAIGTGFLPMAQYLLALCVR